MKTFQMRHSASVWFEGMQNTGGQSRGFEKKMRNVAKDTMNLGKKIIKSISPQNFG